MAELLIKACDATHENKIKDLRGCYKKGYVVVVKPDGWKWGKEELNKEKFYILRVKNADVKDLEYLTNNHEIELATEYVKESPVLGIHVSGVNKTEVENEFTKRVGKVLSELKAFGLDINVYNINEYEQTIRAPIARRRYKVDVSAIENNLKKDIVEIDLKDLKIIDQRQEQDKWQLK